MSRAHKEKRVEIEARNDESEDSFTVTKKRRKREVLRRNIVDEVIEVGQVKLEERIYEDS